MESEMRTDVELLIALCDSGPTVVDRRTGRSLTINAKALSLWSGLSVQTISDYKTGKYNIPISFWRSILDHCVEPRIVSLLIPDGVLFEMVDPCGLALVQPPQFFRKAVESGRAYFEQQERLADILADGRIDELDAASVQAFSDAYDQHRFLDAALHRAIVGTFRAAESRKAGVS